MTTDFTKIENSFYSQFRSKTLLDQGLVHQFFLNALSEFESQLYPIEYNEETETINNELTRPEINLLGKLMYKSYLSRELDRVLKLSNIVGRDLSLTGTGESKRSVQARYEALLDEINQQFNTLKTNSYYE